MTNITISAQVFEDMADRIEELEAKLFTCATDLDTYMNAHAALEAKLAVAWDTQTVKILVTSAYKEGWADGADNVPLGSGWKKSRTNATLAELTGGKDE